MASSSLSQESLDIEDYDVMTRRSRQRPLRSRVMVHKNESIETTDDKDLEEELDSLNDRKENAENAAMYSSLGSAAGLGEHESPTRMANRQKDKRGRVNHLHKGKTVKDKRKLREKRRSTGVVHLASTECTVFQSTGDSLDEGDGKDTEMQTRRNTTYNEVIDADNPQTPEEERKSFSARNVRNKSPSDLDADLEDNQDYDSTVSQSETNLTMIGQSAPSQMAALVDFHMEASEGVARPSTQRSLPPNGAVVQPMPRAREDHPHPHHKHPSHRQQGDGRPFGVHFRDVDMNKARTVSMDTGGAFKRTCTTHDGMEARLLAKTVELEKQLEKERDEKRILQELLDERDHKITQLESELSLLNKDLEEADEENDRLQKENDALITAMGKMNMQ